jgi:2-polyprenyl-3-methyl-5-hydroxy-6-metoxy-1,4-benzoquinol methylase
VPGDAERIAELNAIVEAVRNRVRNAWSQAENGAGTNATPSGAPAPIRFPSTDLMPLVHARDAAQAKVAAIGSVNPRAGGLLNRAVQTFKKLIARALQWFVRDQVVFNRETIAALEATLEALAEQNRSLLTLTSQANERFSALYSQILETRDLGTAMHGLRDELRESKDIRLHWVEWRAAWEQKLATNEIQFLRATADLQGAFQHRVTLIENNFREMVHAQHSDYLGALDRTNMEIQKRFGSDMARIREGYERMIHSELRLIRLRAAAPSATSSIPSPAVPAAVPVAAMDYGRFAERFRGTEDEIRRSMEFYRPVFAYCDNVLDIGCGRGEFLEVMRDAGVHARGIDLSAESVAQCRDK